MKTILAYIICHQINILIINLNFIGKINEFDTLHFYDNKENSSKEKVIEDLNKISNLMNLIER